MDVSIIIVNYNTCELTRNCLKSIFEQTKDIDFEVIVADNDSHDGSVEMIKTEFPQVVLIETGANLGFGRANNRGLAIAKGKYIFYLNSDTILLNNAVKIFFDYFENDKTGEIGALGGWLTDENGERSHSHGKYRSINEAVRGFYMCWRGCVSQTLQYMIPPLKRCISMLRKNTPIAKNDDEIICTKEVEIIIGADLFVKNNEFAKFDERYFMYREEDDLQLQLHKAGLKSYLIEGPRIIHLVGKSPRIIHSVGKSPAKTNDFFWSSFFFIQVAISDCRFFEKNLKNTGGGYFNYAS